MWLAKYFENFYHICCIAKCTGDLNYITIVLYRFVQSVLIWPNSKIFAENIFHSISLLKTQQNPILMERPNSIIRFLDDFPTECENCTTSCKSINCIHSDELKTFEESQNWCQNWSKSYEEGITMALPNRPSSARPELSKNNG